MTYVIPPISSNKPFTPGLQATPEAVGLSDGGGPLPARLLVDQFEETPNTVDPYAYHDYARGILSDFGPEAPTQEFETLGREPRDASYSRTRLNMLHTGTRSGAELPNNSEMWTGMLGDDTKPNGSDSIKRRVALEMAKRHVYWKPTAPKSGAGQTRDDFVEATSDIAPETATMNRARAAYGRLKTAKIGTYWRSLTQDVRAIGNIKNGQRHIEYQMGVEAARVSDRVGAAAQHSQSAHSAKSSGGAQARIVDVADRASAAIDAIGRPAPVGTFSADEQRKLLQIAGVGDILARRERMDAQNRANLLEVAREMRQRATERDAEAGVDITTRGTHASRQSARGRADIDTVADNRAPVALPDAWVRNAHGLAPTRSKMEGVAADAANDSYMILNAVLMRAGAHGASRGATSVANAMQRAMISDTSRANVRDIETMTRALRIALAEAPIARRVRNDAEFTQSKLAVLYSGPMLGRIRDPIRERAGDEKRVVGALDDMAAAQRVGGVQRGAASASSKVAPAVARSHAESSAGLLVEGSSRANVGAGTAQRIGTSTRVDIEREDMGDI